MRSIRFHDLRHANVSEQLAAGIDPSDRLSPSRTCEHSDDTRSLRPCIASQRHGRRGRDGGAVARRVIGGCGNAAQPSESVGALCNYLTMAIVMGDLPDHLLQAVAERAGRIALVVGAGCSLEEPTSLKLSRAYSLEIHADLVRDGVLVDGDCENPEDLSAVTSAVWAKRASQEEVVTRLPRAEFRNARANQGYREAAALMPRGLRLGGPLPQLRPGHVSCAHRAKRP